MSRLIINCNPDLWDEGLSVAKEAAPALARDPKPGWGWSYYRRPNRWWACSLKDGVSVKLKERGNPDA